MKKIPRKRVQIRLPDDLVAKMKDFILTNSSGNFSGNSLSYYIEKLIRNDLNENKDILKDLDLDNDT